MTTVAKLFETMDYGPAPESAAPALEWLKQHGDGRLGHYIGGQWVAPVEGQDFETINPPTTAVLPPVAQGGQAHADPPGTPPRAAAPGGGAPPPPPPPPHLHAPA